MFTNDTLENKSILVTGGGSGLGLAMSKRFAELGANVVVCGRTKQKLDKAKVELCAINPQCQAVELDVRDYEKVGQVLTKLDQEMGGINGLVNNAAGNFYCSSEDLSSNAFQTVVDIVLNGSFNCTQHFGKLAIAAKRPGVILNILTTYTPGGSPFVLPSACAKAGVYALTRSLAVEWAEYGIRLNAIAPGPIPTEGAWARLMPKQFEEMFKNGLPLKRFGTPEELANLASFLMSDMASYMNGECVTLDGAESLMSGMFHQLANTLPRKELKKVFSQMRPKK